MNRVPNIEVWIVMAVSFSSLAASVAYAAYLHFKGKS